MSGWWSLGGYVTEGCIDQHLAAAVAVLYLESGRSSPSCMLNRVMLSIEMFANRSTMPNILV